MSNLIKTAIAERSVVPDAGEMARINRQTLRELTAEEVFTFRLAACDNQVDRDHERFSDAALEKMAELFVGQPVLMDHRWSAGKQTARIYAAVVETQDDVKRLILSCYMPRTDGTAETIIAIESGVLRECSVGVAVGKAVCSICGANQTEMLCAHFPGREYNGQKCHYVLDDVQDAYEVSLVAVPAQPEAGIIKSKRYGGQESQVPQGGETPAPSEEVIKLAEARMELENKRYGGEQ